MDTALEYTNRLADLLRVERGITADFLLALADFDRRKLYRELGYGSLFTYLHGKLKLSKSAAHARAKAAELIETFPEVEAAIRGGQLCLSVMAELARVLTPENRAEVLPRFFGLSRREAESVAAAIRPVAVIPTRTTVTVLRASASKVHLGEPSSLTVVLPAEPNSPVRDATIPPATSSGGAPVAARPLELAEAPPLLAFALASRSPPRRDAVTPLDADRVRLNITVSRRFVAKLEAATDALGHVFPDGNTADVLERGLDQILAEQARRKGLVEKPRKARPSSDPAYVPAALKREVWTRAGGRCEFVLASGERCGCTRRLEFDHLDPVALVLRQAQDERSRAVTADDVRLCCREHNQLAARRVFGDAVMDRYARARRATASARRSSPPAALRGEREGPPNPCA